MIGRIYPYLVRHLRFGDIVEKYGKEWVVEVIDIDSELAYPYWIMITCDRESLLWIADGEEKVTVVKPVREE
jgi:hypothetical protein